MRIAVVGAGALGRVFAACLQRTGAHVTLVARREGPSTSVFRLARQSMWRRPAEHAEVQVSTTLPEAEFYIIAIRGEQLFSPEGVALCQRLQARRGLVVVLSPALPVGIAKLKELIPKAHLALPAVAAHWFKEQCDLRYWVPPLTATQIDCRSISKGGGDRSSLLAPLAERLNQCGLAARLGPSVAALCPATTIAFFPLQLALAVRPRFRAWREDPALTRLICLGLEQARAVAKRVGPVEPGVRWLVLLLQHHWLLRLGCRVAPRALPRLCAFLEEHFGHKLHAQHDLFMQEVTTLATQESLNVSALSALSASSAGVTEETQSKLPAAEAP